MGKIQWLCEEHVTNLESVAIALLVVFLTEPLTLTCFVGDSGEKSMAVYNAGHKMVQRAEELRIPVD